MTAVKKGVEKKGVEMPEVETTTDEEREAFAAEAVDRENAQAQAPRTES